jgi:hypothetical protein
MRIRLERAGGFLPSATKLDHTINSEELSPSEIEVLERLIAEAGIEELGTQQAPQKARPDASYYRLTIEDKDASHSVKASDADMPSALRPLITWLTTRAQKPR